MFERLKETYSYDPKVLEYILKDEANPLNRIVAELPNKDAKILDIGAGSGIVGALIKKCKKDVVIDGIEPDANARLYAEKFYRNYYEGFVEEFFPVIEEERYDYIILADVLEHLASPDKILKKIFNIISDHTKIFISLPNVTHGAVRLALANGDFNYVDSGILERTHLRFFSPSKAMELLEGCGFCIEQVTYLQRGIEETEFAIKRNFTNYILARCMEKEHFFTYQTIFRIGKNGVKEKEIIKFGRAETFSIWCVLKNMTL